MNKKFKSFTAAIIATALLIIPILPPAALATGKERIVDYIGVLSNSELNELNDYAQEISGKYHLDIAFLLASDVYVPDQTLAEYTEECYLHHQGLGQNGFMLAIDEESAVWNWVGFGDMEDTLTENSVERFFDAYDCKDTYYGGIMAYLDTVGIYLASALGDEKTGLPQPLADERPSRFIDNVGLLTSEQSEMLVDKLDEISDRHQFDTVVAIVPMLDWRKARLYAADLFESSGFGFGEDLDGAILLLATEDRDFGFAALGFGMDVFTPAGQEYLDKLFVPQLKNDQYYEAFMAYADAVDDFLVKAAAGMPYDKANIPTLPSETVKYRLYGIAISLLLALIAALIVTSAWKQQLRSVHKKDLAHAYIRERSMVLTGQRDIFLHR
jgi:uncharacterized protein